MFYKIFVVFFLMIGLLKFALDAPNLFKTIFGEGGFLKGKINPFSELKSTWDDAKKVGSTVKKGYDNLNKGGRAVVGAEMGFRSGYKAGSGDGKGFKSFVNGMRGGARGLIKGAKAGADTKVSWVDDNFKDRFKQAQEAGRMAGMKYSNPRLASLADGNEKFRNAVGTIYNDDKIDGMKAKKAEKDSLKQAKKDYINKRTNEFRKETYEQEFERIQNANVAAKAGEIEAGVAKAKTDEMNSQIAKAAAAQGITADEFVKKAKSGKPEDSKFKQLYDDIEKNANAVGEKFRNDETKRIMDENRADAEVQARKNALEATEEAIKKDGIIEQEAKAIYDKKIEDIGAEIAKKHASALKTPTQYSDLCKATDEMLKIQQESLKNDIVREAFDNASIEKMKAFGSNDAASNIDDVVSSLNITGVNNKASDGTMTYEEMERVYQNLKNLPFSTLNDSQKIALSLIVEKIRDVNDDTTYLASSIQDARNNQKDKK